MQRLPWHRILDSPACIFRTPTYRSQRICGFSANKYKDINHSSFSLSILSHACRLTRTRSRTSEMGVSTCNSTPWVGYRGCSGGLAYPIGGWHSVSVVMVTLRIALPTLPALTALLESSCSLPLQSECSEYPHPASDIAYFSELTPADPAASHWRNQRPTAAI